MTPVRKRLIVSADDFGHNSTANKNILALAEQGHLDRVAVMVRGGISPDEIRRLLETGVALDVHLDIPDLAVPKKGVFGRSSFFLWQYFSGRLSAQKIGSDWAAQIELFQNMFGRSPDGLNSHQHVHFFPPYLKQSIALAQKFNISFLRFGKESILVRHGMISLILRLLRKIERHSFLSSNLESADFLMSLDWIYPVKSRHGRAAFGGFNRVKNPQDFLRHLVPGTTEVVCHPERKEEFEIIKNCF